MELCTSLAPLVPLISKASGQSEFTISTSGSLERAGSQHGFPLRGMPSYELSEGRQWCSSKARYFASVMQATLYPATVEPYFKALILVGTWRFRRAPTTLYK